MASDHNIPPDRPASREHAHAGHDHALHDHAGHDHANHAHGALLAARPAVTPFSLLPMSVWQRLGLASVLIVFLWLCVIWALR